MKKIITITIIGIFVSAGLFAQRTGRSGNRAGRTIVTVEQRVAEMDKQLSLNDAQKSELIEFFKENEAIVKAQREERNSDRATARAESEKRRTEYQTGLKKILGEEKYATWNESGNRRIAVNSSRSASRTNRVEAAQQRSGRSGNRNAASATTRSAITPKEQAERLSEQLQLTDSQKQQLEQHFTEMRNARSESIQNDADSRSDRRRNAQVRQEVNDTKLKEILGEKKFKELQEGRSNRRVNRR